MDAGHNKLDFVREAAYRHLPRISEKLFQQFLQRLFACRAYNYSVAVNHNECRQVADRKAVRGDPGSIIWLGCYVDDGFKRRLSVPNTLLEFAELVAQFIKRCQAWVIYPR